MMLTERLTYLLIGLALGFLAGYITRTLQKIERKVDDVDRIVKQRNEKGFMRVPLLADAFMLMIFAIMVFATFQTQAVNNDVKSTQESQRVTTKCTQQYLSKTIKALNERTEYTRQTAELNVELQQAQAEFLSLALSKPSAEVDQGLRRYVKSLTDFVDASARTREAQTMNPYPTEDEFSNCVNSEKE